MELIQELTDLERDQEEQIDLILEIRILLLKDLDAMKAYVAALDIKNAGEQKEQVNKLKRKPCQLLWSINFSGLQDQYIYLKEIYPMFNSKMMDLIRLLKTDEEGNPKYPARGRRSQNTILTMRLLSGRLPS